MGAFQVLYREDSIYLDLMEVYPQEGCGLLVNKKGKIEWMSCRNTSDTPEESFHIDASDYIKARLQGDIYAIVHSHPDFSCEPSEADKKASDFLGIPYIVYSLPNFEKYEYIPKKLNNELLGRDYNFGTSDCYSLARDYYFQEFNINLPTIQFEDDWWEQGLDYFGDLFENFGFEEVEDPQIGDGILFKVFCNVENHCGIYLGEDIFLHHAVNRLSCRESLYPLWIKHKTRFIRYAKS